MVLLSQLSWVDESGYHYADYATFLQYFQEGYRNIYGADLYLEADSQDGQAIALEAKAAYDTAVRGKKIYDSMSPKTAIGVALSNNVKLNGIARQVATKSTVDLLITGVVGTTIINGFAVDELGQRWFLPSSVVIPIAGSITVTATAEDEGEISAAPDTVNVIGSPTRGWQLVNNEVAATEGAPVETDAELRQRQTISVSLPSLSVFEGTQGAVENVEGVVRSKGYENDSGVTDGDGIPAHSIAMIVEGGDNQEIAEAIALHKTPGTRTFGTTGVTVYDRYGVPNTINFSRPDIVQIKVQVTLNALAGYTSGYDELIKQAIFDSINGLDIGENVLITKLFVPANLPNTEEGKTFDIETIEIAKVADAFGTINVPIVFNEAAANIITNIVVVVL